MTNTQLYLAIGVPLIIYLISNVWFARFVDAKFEAVNERFESLLAYMGSRFDAVDKRLTSIENSIKTLSD